MMKLGRCIGCISFVIGILFSGIACASGETATVTLTLKVTIATPTCTLAVPSSLDLGTHKITEFNNAGSSESHEFDVTISDCGSSGMMGHLVFEGESDADKEQAWANAQGEGYATGVGVSLSTNNGDVSADIAPGYKSDPFSLPEPGDVAVRPYYARISGTGPVTAGNVSSSATISLEYD